MECSKLELLDKIRDEVFQILTEKTATEIRDEVINIINKYQLLVVDN